MIPVPHRRLRSMTDLAARIPSATPLPDADEPLAILSARMIGQTWSPEAHEHLIAVLRKIDATATECVRRAGGEA